MTLEGTEKIKTEKITTTQLTQPQECIQVLQVLFSLNENTPSTETGKKFQNLAMWVFSKIVKSMKGKSKLIYSLFVYKLLTLGNCLLNETF